MGCVSEEKILTLKRLEHEQRKGRLRPPFLISSGHKAVDGSVPVRQIN
jgi:hypothetical protein